VVSESRGKGVFVDEKCMLKCPRGYWYQKNLKLRRTTANVYFSGNGSLAIDMMPQSVSRDSCLADGCHHNAPPARSIVN
jgi:hypothetical protein